MAAAAQPAFAVPEFGSELTALGFTKQSEEAIVPSAGEGEEEASAREHRISSMV